MNIPIKRFGMLAYGSRTMIMQVNTGPLTLTFKYSIQRVEGNKITALLDDSVGHKGPSNLNSRRQSTHDNRTWWRGWSVEA